MFDTTEVSEDTLRDLRKQDVLSEMLRELGVQVPTLKQVLIDERDQYLAQKIREADGRRIVAVVGAGHVEGIVEILQQNRSVPLEDLDRIPPMSPVWKWVGWSIPVIILGSIALIGFRHGAHHHVEQDRHGLPVPALQDGPEILLVVAGEAVHLVEGLTRFRLRFGVDRIIDGAGVRCRIEAETERGSQNQKFAYRLSHAIVRADRLHYTVDPD